MSMMPFLLLALLFAGIVCLLLHHQIIDIRYYDDFFLFRNPLVNFLFRNQNSISNDDDNDNDWMPNVTFGNYSMPITTHPRSMSKIQSLFDVGLMECYGFAFVEAKKTANQILQLLLEPQYQHCFCPMCHWLVAMGHSPYINHPIIVNQTDINAATEAATAALLEARALYIRLSAKEIGLIEAMHLRFSSDNQTIGYLHYKDRLQRLHEQLNRGDADVMAFLADAIMILHSDAEDGYKFYDGTTSNPLPDIVYATSLLEDCLALNPHHPLGQHLYIHITEPSDHMVRQFSGPVADRLANDTKHTQTQHLQHMPSHSYVRTGRYHDAVLSNQLAHRSDQVYELHAALPCGPAHNLVVLLHAARLSGEMKVAYNYSNILRDLYRTHPERPDGPGIEAGWHVWRTLRLDFGDFVAMLQDSDDIPQAGETTTLVNLIHSKEETSVSDNSSLDKEETPWPYTVVLGSYAKGVASIWRNDVPDTYDRLSDAEHYRARLLKVLPLLVNSSYFGMGKVAMKMLNASISYYRILSNTTATTTFQPILSYLREARVEQESWTYTEPPPWHASLWLCEGTLLRIMGHHEEARDAFEANLNRLPENRLGLYGLLQVLEEVAGHRQEEISDLRKRFERASFWADDGVKERPPLVCPELGE